MQHEPIFKNPEETFLRLIPLGGIGNVTKNMYIYELRAERKSISDILIVDCGIGFPDEGMYGIDLVIPDITYLKDKIDKIRGIIITHGHEDHIGALPYILPELNVPVYCTRLTEGLISIKLKDRRALARADIRMIEPGGAFTLGKFRIEFFPTCHSIPDSVGLIIRTPIGTIVHTSDFKLDHTPVCGQPTDLSKLAVLGAEGVLLLMSDSTYAELPGYTPSEKIVGQSIDRIAAHAP